MYIFPSEESLEGMALIAKVNYRLFEMGSAKELRNLLQIDKWEALNFLTD